MNVFDPIPKNGLEKLSVRTRNVLVAYSIKTLGDLLQLDHDRVMAMRNAGKKTADEVMALRARFLEGKIEAEPEEVEPEEMESEEMRLEVPSDTPLPSWALRKLSERSRKRLLAAFPDPTVGDVCSLEEAEIRSWQGAGKLVADELLRLKDRFLADGVVQPASDEEPSPSDYASLAEMLLALEGSGKPSAEWVMRRYLGLLNVSERCTLEVCGGELHVTRERIRQIAIKVQKRLFYYPRQKALVEVEAVVKDCFETHDCEVKAEDLIAAVESAFAWTGTTDFSLIRLLDELGWKIVELPEGRGLGWNMDGRFDWVADYVPPTRTEKRRSAIKQLLLDAGYEGLTVDEIYAACTERFPELQIKAGNIRGAMNGPLDEKGTRIIPYSRGTRLNNGTKYSLNTFFQDEQTRAALEDAALRIRAHMEKTGLGVVSVWKAYSTCKLPVLRPLPKLGFYMMMRDLQSGGLSYPDYPRIAYPGITVVEDTFPWMLFMYCKFCGRMTATYSQIMYFFTECLGLQPSIALSCAFNSMGLKKSDEGTLAPYEIKAPNKGPAPALLLPPIAEYRDFSLVKVSSKPPINPYYLDEGGRALTHGAYAKLFFRALEEKKFVFPADEFAGLKDRRWCQVNIKGYRAVFRSWKEGDPIRVPGYWREKFVFGDETVLISDDWDARNKSAFDKWASRISALSGVPFEPYEVQGLSVVGGVKEADAPIEPCLQKNVEESFEGGEIESPYVCDLFEEMLSVGTLSGYEQKVIALVYEALSSSERIALSNRLAEENDFPVGTRGRAEEFVSSLTDAQRERLLVDIERCLPPEVRRRVVELDMEMELEELMGTEPGSTHSNGG